MTAAPNFRQLVDEARRRGRAAHLRPRSIAWAARRCGISVPHLYNLTHGRKRPPDWTVERIAMGLGVGAAAVRRALDQSRAEARAA